MDQCQNSIQCLMAKTLQKLAFDPDSHSSTSYLGLVSSAKALGQPYCVVAMGVCASYISYLESLWKVWVAGRCCHSFLSLSSWESYLPYSMKILFKSYADFSFNLILECPCSGSSMLLNYVPVYLSSEDLNPQHGLLNGWFSRLWDVRKTVCFLSSRYEGSSLSQSLYQVMACSHTNLREGRGQRRVWKARWHVERTATTWPPPLSVKHHRLLAVLFSKGRIC